MIYDINTLGPDDMVLVREYMKTYTETNPRSALTVNDSDGFIDLSPASAVFQEPDKIAVERISKNSTLRHFEYVSMCKGEVLGVFYFTVDEYGVGMAFTIYRADRSNPYEFGKDVQRAYKEIHRKTKAFVVVTIMDGDNAAEIERVKNRGAVYHLSKRYHIMQEKYTLKEIRNRVVPIRIMTIQGAL